MPESMLSRRELLLRAGVATAGLAVLPLLLSGCQDDPPPPSTSSGVWQQDWHFCSKCQGLFFAGNNVASVCPAGDEHDMSASGNYSLLDNASPASGGYQDDWRFCRKCQGLFFAGNNGLSVCPDGGEHDQGSSGNYSLLLDASPAPAGYQDDWRFCRKCQGLFFAGNGNAGRCPKGDAHDGSTSGNYAVLQV